jgi:Tol biopolymer transport system component
MSKLALPCVIATLVGVAVPALGAGPRTALVSKNSAGAAADENSSSASTSGSGRFVAFQSFADNLPGDPVVSDIFVHDRETGKTRLVSRTSAGQASQGDSFFPSISRSGRYVAFFSNADNLPGDDASLDVYLHDRKTGKTRLVSRTSAGEPAVGDSTEPAVSASGRFVAFSSDATNLPGNDLFGDVYVHDRKTGKTRLVSRSSAGEPADGTSFGRAAISASGRYVAFFSDADNLPGDDSVTGAYVHDRRTGRTRFIAKITIGQQPEGGASASMSGSGRYVAFGSEDNGSANVYVHDRRTGKTRLVSRTSAGAPADGPSFGPSLSATGRYVAFSSEADNLPGDDSVGNVYLRDLEIGRTRLISRTSAGVPADTGSSRVPAIAGSGRYVAFTSDANNLPGPEGRPSVYIHGPLR